jgi:hypothetical protein
MPDPFYQAAKGTQIRTAARGESFSAIECGALQPEEVGRMKYLYFWKGMEEAYFRKVDKGYLFFPYGILTRGYEVTADKKAEIAAFIRTYYTYSTITLLIGIAVNLLIPLALLVPLLAFYAFKIHRLVAGAPRSATRLSYSEATASMASTVSTGRITFLVVGGIVMTAAAAFVLWMGLATGNQHNLWMGAIGVAFFGFCLWRGIQMARLKAESAK